MAWLVVSDASNVSYCYPPNDHTLRALGYPNSYVGSVHGIVSQPDYTSAVKQGILAAGDNCSRLIFTGACVGARGGLDAIPEEWINQMTNAKTVLECIETVVQL